MEVRHAAVEGGDTAAASGQELDRRCSAPASPSRERRRRPRGRWLLECARVGPATCGLGSCSSGSEGLRVPRRQGARRAESLRGSKAFSNFIALRCIFHISTANAGTRPPTARAVRFYNPVAGTIPNPGPGRRDRFRRSGKRPRGGAGRGDGRRMRLAQPSPVPRPGPARGAGLCHLLLRLKPRLGHT